MSRHLIAVGAIVLFGLAIRGGSRPHGEKILRDEARSVSSRARCAPQARGRGRRDHPVRSNAALYFTREILIPFAFALTLTFLLAPVVALLQRLHLGRVVSVLTTVLVAIAVASGIGWIIASQLVDVANQLPHYRQNIHTKIAAFHLPVAGQLGHAAQSVQEVMEELRGPAAQFPASPPPRQMQKSPIRRRQPRYLFPFAWSNPRPTDGRTSGIWARQLSLQ